ncbi:hypothetical protein FGG08_007222 [Glutinoglossum americanum]|uniref:alpha-L-fucosidase n=1 Tax=Glutinoglossum americanum TaxID=1670608 RepID=A0A9P8HZR9_9PEZI|nr:hypothetical protein FGG08_007222 [Glutinoglossum americanum]
MTSGVALGVLMVTAIGCSEKKPAAPTPPPVQNAPGVAPAPSGPSMPGAVPGAHGPAPAGPGGAGPAPTPPHMRWWREARFGLFIHWGPITLKGAEISWSRNPNPYGPNAGGIPATEYDSLYKRFNPVHFNAKEIVALAKAAGMKYIVFTCKHHDGFCEFDSQVTDYKITSPQSPYRRDIVRQMADACREAGLHWCVYYSQPDIHHPDYKVNQPKYNAYFHRQVNELLTRYGKVDLVWFDGIGNTAAFWEAKNLFPKMRAVNPDLIINDRCGLPGDYYTPEQTIGSYDDQRPWETCMTIGEQWSYKPGDHYKSAVQCIQTLARCAGGDGNLLLNIGPRPDGSLDPTQADRLRALARWMKTHHTAIEETRGGPYKPTSSYVSTRRGDTVYVHVLRWDGDTITLPALPRRIRSGHLVGGGKAQVTQSARGVTIQVPTTAHDAADTIIALRLDGTAMNLAAIEPARPPFQTTLSASNVYQKDPAYAASKAGDDDINTRWATDSGTRQAWLQADFAPDARIRGVRISEAIAGRVRRFEIQYRAPGKAEWVTVATGKRLGESNILPARELNENLAVLPKVVKMIYRGILMLALVLLFCAGPTHAEVPSLNGKRVLFLGDSITQDGTYVSLVEYYLDRHYPSQKFDIISIGLASETVSGLSEKAHPFPRPWVHTRLQAALNAVKPNIVVACYGMNDGIYWPQSPARRTAFQKGIKELIAKCKAAGAKVILLTPPPFDPTPLKGKTLPATAPDFSYMTPFAQYDSVLEEYGRWECTLPRSTGQVIDLHAPLAHYIAKQRQTNPGFVLSGDGIHPAPIGHLVMASAILKALGVSVTVNDAELARVLADPLYQLVARRRQLRSEGWLPYVGYTRDGTFKTDSIAKTEQEAATLQIQIEGLRRKNNHE